jgi:hypothetical protein
VAANPAWFGEDEILLVINKSKTMEVQVRTKMVKVGGKPAIKWTDVREFWKRKSSTEAVHTRKGIMLSDGVWFQLISGVLSGLSREELLKCGVSDDELDSTISLMENHLQRLRSERQP